jgi:hypothetical protein
MIKRWFFLLAVVPLFAQAQDESISYKGVTLGSSMEEYMTKLPEHDCLVRQCTYLAVSCEKKSAKCREKNSFGGVNVSFASSYFRDDKLVRISIRFRSGDFDTLEAAVSDRLGAPTKSENKSIQNRMGAIFENRDVIWERPGMSLRIGRHGAEIGVGYAHLVTPDEVARQTAESESKNKAAAKDF